MKKSILGIFCIMFLFGCESKEDVIKDNITVKIKEKLKNPDSFEFVSMAIVESITVKDRKRDVANKQNLDEIIEINKTYPAKDLLHEIETEYKFVQDKDDSEIAVYLVDFVSKGTNSFGAIIQSKYRATVLNDKKYSVLGISANKD